MTELFIATPLYGGMMRGEHHMACLELQELLSQKGIKHKFGYRFDESLITRARNKIAKRFLDSQATHLMIFDADITFVPKDVLRLLELSTTHPGIIGAPYSKKGIDWERIARVSASPKQVPISSMSKFGAMPCANFLHKEFSLVEPTEVRHFGTGYMLIPRHVFTELDKNPRVLSYKLGEQEVKEMGCERLTAYFEAKVIDDEYPSEDWYFCDRYREVGGKVWLCAWMTSVHMGTHGYPMDIRAIAEAGEEL